MTLKGFCNSLHSIYKSYNNEISEQYNIPDLPKPEVRRQEQGPGHLPFFAL
jgi:hypothetical protein